MAEDTTSRPLWQRKWLKRLLIFSLSIAVVVVVLFLGISAYIYSGQLNRAIISQAQDAAALYGLRLEVDDISLNWQTKQAQLNRVKLFNKKTDKLLTEVEHIEVTAEIPEMYALNTHRQVILQNLNLEGVKLFLEFKADGSSNFTGLQSPPSSGPSAVDIDYSHLLANISNSSISLKDEGTNSTLILNKVDLKAQAKSATKGIIAVTVNGGEATYQTYHTIIESLALKAEVSDQGLQLESSQLVTDLGKLQLSGQLNNWKQAQYQLNIQADTEAVNFPEVQLHGSSQLQAQVTGSMTNAHLTGKLNISDAVVADTHIKGLQIADIDIKTSQPFAAQLAWQTGKVKLEVVTANTFKAQEIALPNCKGNISGNSVNMQLPSLAIASVALPEKDIRNLQLKEIEVKLIDKKATTKVKQALIAGVSIPKGELASVELNTLVAESEGTNYKVQTDVAFAKGHFDRLEIQQTHGKLQLDNRIATISNLQTQLLGGQAELDAQLSLVGTGNSHLQAKFQHINSVELAKLRPVTPLPIEGLIAGQADLNWPGLNVQALRGEVDANIQGETTTKKDRLPLTAQLVMLAKEGNLEIKPLTAKLGAAQITAQATFFPKTNSIVAQYQVETAQAAQLLLLAERMDLLTPQVLSYQPELVGRLKVVGQVGGTLDKPIIAADIEADSLGVKANKFQALKAKVQVTSQDLNLVIDQLLDTQGGMLSASYQGKIADPLNTGQLKADLQNFHLSLYQQDTNKELFIGAVSGRAEFVKLGDSPEGTAQLSLVNSLILSQKTDSVDIKLSLANQNLQVDSLLGKSALATVQGQGSFQLKTNDFKFQGQISKLDLAKLNPDSMVQGEVAGTVQVSGNTKDLKRLQLNLQAASSQLRTPTNQLGGLSLSAKSDNQGRIQADIVSTFIARHPQTVRALISLAEPHIPIEIESDLEKFDIALLLEAFETKTSNTTISSKLTGKISVKGNLFNNKDQFDLSNFQGAVQLTKANVTLADQLFIIEAPTNIVLDKGKVDITKLHLFNDSTDLSLNGQLGLLNTNSLDFTAKGVVNLSQINSLIPNRGKLKGLVNLNAKLAGTVASPKFSGDVQLSSLGFSQEDLPVEFNNGNGLITLTEEKIILNNFAIKANDGQITGTGAIDLTGFKPTKLQLDLATKNVNLIYQGAAMTLEGDLALVGTQLDSVLHGNLRVLEASYLKPFDINALTNTKISSADEGVSDTSLFSPRLDIHITADNSIIVHNAQINTVASGVLNLAGKLADPTLSGRLLLEGGNITFRGQRYDINDGTLDVPGGIITPTINLFAEGQVNSYLVYIHITGPIDQIDLDLESEPNLTRNEILALITTGQPDTTGGSDQDLTTSGLSTGANLIAQELISKPFGKKAEQVFGLNQFQIDPIIRPNENPSARLTVGRQIIPKLGLTYSTGLSGSKDQSVILEYNLSTRFSSLFSFTQSDSNSTKSNDNQVDVSLEVRGRERFSLGKKDKPLIVNQTLSKLASLKKLNLPDAEVIVDKPDSLKLSKDSLRELLPIKQQAFSLPLARVGEQNLANYLQERGYFFAKVTTTCDPIDCQGSNLKVHYEVDPGSRYEVREIIITGTNLLSSDSVLSQLQSRKKNFIGKLPFFKSLPVIGGYANGITSNERLRQDSELIRQQLIDLGYRKATVAYNYAVDPDGRGIQINFDIMEGPLSQIGEIVLQGEHELTATELQNVITLHVGDHFDPNRPRQVARDLQDYYAQRGYLESRIDLILEGLPNDDIRLVYQINEGTPSTVYEVKVEGLTEKHKKNIYRFIDLKPGDLITNKKLLQLRKDLYATSNFRDIQILTEPVEGGDAGSRRVLIKLTEAKPLLVLYSLGFSTEDGPRGALQISNTDFLGKVNNASLRLRLSQPEQSLQLQLTDPRTLGSRWSTTVLSLYDRVAKLSGSKQPITNLDKVGLDAITIGLVRFSSSIQAERHLTEHTSIRFRYNFDLTRLLNIEDNQLSSLTGASKITRISALSAGLTYDTRNNPLNPTKGQFFSADYSFATSSLGGNESFNKLITNYQYYTKLDKASFLPIIKDSVFAFSSRVGIGAPFQIRSRLGNNILSFSDHLLPFSERFRTGGATTLRGFKFETAGPAVVVESGNAPAQLISLGGDALVVLNFELRYPITSRLQLVPFYDLGNVFLKVRDINLDKMSKTIGLGLRFNTPIGPIGIDYGYLLNPQSFITPNKGVLTQRQGIIHIKFGQSF